MRKNRFTEVIAKHILKKAIINDKGLELAGFSLTKDGFSFANLTIFTGDGYYYYSPSAERIIIKNMQQVSDLIYGKTPFLDMSNGG